MKKILLFFVFLLLSINIYAKLIKISADLEVLTNDAKKWSCIFDSKSNLMWELKSTGKGLHNTKNTYTWFDGLSGVENGEYSHNCNWGNNCNSLAFIIAINKKLLCQLKTWRLPTKLELRSLLRYNDAEALIDVDFFPNTQSKSYWSSQSDVNNPNIAIDVPFFYGGTESSDKFFDSHIRAVVDVK